MKTNIGSHVIHVEPVSERARGRAQERLDNLTKPLGSLGELETVVAKLAAATDRPLPSIRAPRTIIFAADHGVTEFPVSAYGPEVTEEMAVNICMGSAVSSVLARNQSIPLELVDVGIRTIVRHPSAVVRKVAAGTQNIATGPAMNRSQAEQAVLTGIERAGAAINAGCDLLVLGELGIGNTTVAAALLSVLLDRDPSELVGRGTGIDDGQLRRKTEMIQQAIAVNTPDVMDTWDVLTKLGGFEVAAMTGACLAAAARRVPILLDGVITGAAAVLAERLNANVGGYLLASHLSPEPAHALVLEALALRPLITAGLRLGEGSGALLTVSIIQRACEIAAETATFEDARVTNPHVHRLNPSNIQPIEGEAQTVTPSPAHADFDDAERNAVYKAILARRDIRVFLADAVPDDVLQRILTAAHHGPSVGYMQPWNFILIEDKTVLARIQSVVDRERVRASTHYQDLKRDYYLRLKVEGLMQAPLTICVTNDTKRGGPHVLGRNTIPETDLMSTSCAIENLWLAARVEGVAVGWVSMYEKQDIRNILQMPEHVDPVALLSIGYTSHFPDIPVLERVGWGERLNLTNLVFHNRWEDTEEGDS